MKLSSFNARVETVTTKPFFREAFTLPPRLLS
jgi:putative SOS response-associated peptidase YedK